MAEIKINLTRLMSVVHELEPYKKIQISLVERKETLSLNTETLKEFVMTGSGFYFVTQRKVKRKTEKIFLDSTSFVDECDFLNSIRGAILYNRLHRCLVISPEESKKVCEFMKHHNIESYCE